MTLFHDAWQAAFAVMEKLEQQGFEAVIVGGAVRDYILGREVHDVDVATSALPEEVKTIFSRTVDVGIAHGTVLVLHDLAEIEVTTFRTDGTYVDHRRPESVQFVRSLAEDLLRRDFTINAMAMRHNQSIVDLFGGKADLDARIIRAVGEAEDRFQEDALRMLRAVRFAAQLGFKIEEQTLAAMVRYAKDITLIARERIKAELDKIWISHDVYNGMTLIEQTTLCDFLEGSFQPALWRHFQTTHSDVGWAFFVLTNPSNRQEMLQFYRLSNKEKAFVRAVVEAYECLLSTGWQKKDYFRFELRVLLTAHQFAQYLQQQLDGMTVTSIIEAKEQLPIKSKDELVVSGHDFLQWTNQKRGPWLKEVLDALLLAVLSGECNNNRTSIKEWFSKWVQ